MLIYDLSRTEGKPLYEFLYECLKRDILNGRLHAGSRLPSKREFARDNNISIKTVMNAYDQLLTEGYILSRERSGYFVADVEAIPEYSPQLSSYPKIYREEEWFVDFTANNTVYEKFPFSTWGKVMREVLAEIGPDLMHRAHFLGVESLREAIADYLYRFRGMTVSPECIVIGAGIEYLYGRLIKILPRHSIFAMEDPGYRKIPRIFDDAHVVWKSIDMDEDGIDMDCLRISEASVVHVSPEHHYPLGMLTSAVRRQELLHWAASEPDRYIIEDDYDCEFRYRSHSIPALQSMDRNQRIIYMNTFSKTLAPSIRISYMVLPERLTEQYIRSTNFYSNTASSCEQYALAKFIREGYFERHVSRLKKIYHARGELLTRIIRQSEHLPVISVEGGESGTHLLVRLDTDKTDAQIKYAARQQGINLACLSDFCLKDSPKYHSILVLNYSDMDEIKLREAVRRLELIFSSLS